MLGLADLRFSLRSLLHAPKVLVSAVLCLAGGIGVTSVMLGTLDLLLLRPPAHIEEPTSVRRLFFVFPALSLPQSSVPYPTYSDLGATGVFAELAAVARLEGSVGRGTEAQRARLAFVTPSFFSLLKVNPARGRLFVPAEGHPERAELVALVSWEFWQGRLAGTADILGKLLPIGDNSYTVIGVLPPRFTGVDLLPIDVWLPISAAGPLWIGAGLSTNRDHSWLEIIARLRPESTIQRAESEATAVYRRALTDLGREAADTRVLLLSLQPGRTPGGASQSRLAAWLAASSSAVLLIACANVAGLLIVRSLDRRRELGARLALGASRAQLARLLLAESLVLALLSGLGGWIAAWFGGSLLRAFLLPAIPPPNPADLRMVTLVSSLSVFAGFVTGLAPAFWGSRSDVGDALAGGSRELGPGRNRFRGAVLLAQVIVSFLLLVGAGLFLRSLNKLYSLRLGFDRERTFVATANLMGAGYSPQQIDAFFRDALARARGLPGVAGAGVAIGIPVRSSFGSSVVVSGRGNAFDLAPGGVYFNAVTADFFATLGTRLLRGRALRERDDRGTDRVAVINQTMARLLWPGQNPIDECFYVPDDKAPCTTVIGVVEDTLRGQLREPPTMQFYVPLSQAPEWASSRALFFRASGNAGRVAGAVRRELQSLDRDLPYVDIRRLGEVLDPQTRPWRMGAALFSVFAALALVLAVVGIFTSVAHAVSSRTAELGVRMALGARFGELLWLVMRFAVGLAAAGVAIGLALSLWLGHKLGPLLFEVSASDPLVHSLAATSLLGAAFLASLYPALRIRSIDPALALRAE